MTVALFGRSAPLSVWVGSTGAIAVSTLSGEFQVNWIGSTARIGVGQNPGVWSYEQTWLGSTGQIGVAGHSDYFIGVPGTNGRANTTVLGRSTTETLSGQSRAAMMVGTGRSRTGGS